MNFIMKRQLEMKKQSKKGFTLVEVIVVIVIIAILAAIAVPALTGYIEKAKEKSAMADAKHILTALQTVSNESYVTGAVIYGSASINGKPRINGPYYNGHPTSDKTYLQSINELVGKEYKSSNFGVPAANSNSNQLNFGPEKGNTKQGIDSAIYSFLYIADDGIKVEYTRAGGFKIIP